MATVNLSIIFVGTGITQVRSSNATNSIFDCPTSGNQPPTATNNITFEDDVELVSFRAISDNDSTIYDVWSSNCTIQDITESTFNVKFTSNTATIYVYSYESTNSVPITGIYIFNNNYIPIDYYIPYYKFNNINYKYGSSLTEVSSGDYTSSGFIFTNANVATGDVMLTGGNAPPHQYINGELNVSCKYINFGASTQLINSKLNDWIQANAEPIKYKVSFSLTNCTVEIDKTEYRQGDEVSFTLKPNFGYFNTSATARLVTGEQLLLNTVGINKYSFIMPAQNLTITGNASISTSAVEVECTALSAVTLYVPSTGTNYFLGSLDAIDPSEPDLNYSTQYITYQPFEVVEGYAVPPKGHVVTDIITTNCNIESTEPNKDTGGLNFNFTFTDNTATFNIESEPINYSITKRTDNYTIISAPSTAHYGNPVTINVSSTTGYKISTVRYRTSSSSTYYSLTSVGNNGYKFLMPADDVIIEAYSVEDSSYQSTSAITMNFYGSTSGVVIQSPGVSNFTGWLQDGELRSLSYDPGTVFTLYVNSDNLDELYYVSATGATVSSINSINKTFNIVFTNDNVVVNVYSYTMTTINGTYILRDALTSIGDKNTYIFNNLSYTSNGVVRTGFQFDNLTNWTLRYIGGSQPPVVYDSSSGWTADEYQTIDFGSSLQRVPTIFKSWLEENQIYENISLTFIFDEGINSITGIGQTWNISGSEQILSIDTQQKHEFTINLNADYIISNVSAIGATVSRSDNILTITFTSSSARISITTVKDEEEIEQTTYNIIYHYSNATLTNIPSSAEANSIVSFIVTANSGYNIDSVLAQRTNGNNISITKSGSTYSFTMPDSDVIVTVLTSEVVTYKTNLILTFDNNISSVYATIKDQLYTWSNSGQSNTIDCDLNINYYFIVNFNNSNYKINNIGADNCYINTPSNNGFYVSFNNTNDCTIDITSVLIDSSSPSSNSNNGIPFWSPIATNKIIDRTNNRDLLVNNGNTTIVGNTSTTLRLNMSNLSLNGSTGTKGSLLQSGGTSTASWRSVEDSNNASPLNGNSNSIPTVRDIYHGLPSINGTHSYTSNNSIYAPTTGGTRGYILQSMGSEPPVWISRSSTTWTQKYLHIIKLVGWRSENAKPAECAIEWFVDSDKNIRCSSLSDLYQLMATTTYDCFGFGTDSINYSTTTNVMWTRVQLQNSTSIKITGIQMSSSVATYKNIILQNNSESKINLIDDMIIPYISTASSITSSNKDYNVTLTTQGEFQSILIYVPSTGQTYTFDSNNTNYIINASENEVLTLTVEKRTSSGANKWGLDTVTGNGFNTYNITETQCDITFTEENVSIIVNARSYEHLVTAITNNTSCYINNSGIGLANTYREGEVLELKVIPNSGYTISEVVANTSTEEVELTYLRTEDTNTNIYSFTMPTEDVIITATAS